jgi:hypothetical protein
MRRQSWINKKPLSGPQRGLLARVAKEAFNRLSRGLSESFDDWRKAEARAVTSNLPNAPAEGWSISEAPAWTFNALFAHFKALKGETDVAMDYLTGPDTEMRNYAHLISEAEDAAEVGPDYTAGICRQMFGFAEPKTPDQAVAVLTALKKMAVASRVQDACDGEGIEMPF